MYKDFDSWNILKKKIEDSREIFCNEREVWWCHLGINVGSEVCGKNNPFERPVLVLKVFNKNLILVAPITTKYKNTNKHIRLISDNFVSFVILEHVKSISTRRLSRKVRRLDHSTFNAIYQEYKNLIN